MIHGIYVRIKPKFRWRLVSQTVSGELATKDKEDTLDKCKKAGFEEAEVAIQLFESQFFIPETLGEIKKEEKILLN